MGAFEEKDKERRVSEDLSDGDFVDFYITGSWHEGQVIDIKEQDCLCLSDSSMQGRQKACPQGVITGKIMASRQIGQLNFSIPMTAIYFSSQKSILPLLLAFLSLY